MRLSNEEAEALRSLIEMLRDEVRFDLSHAKTVKNLDARAIFVEAAAEKTFQSNTLIKVLRELGIRRLPPFLT